MATRFLTLQFQVLSDSLAIIAIQAKLQIYSEYLTPIAAYVLMVLLMELDHRSLLQLTDTIAVGSASQ